MQAEIEAKFLDIEPDKIREKLKSLGATLEYPERLMKRKNFDFPDLRLDREKHGWVRVRDEGDKITVSYKQVDDMTIHGTKEIVAAVSDFDSMCAILEAVGLKVKAEQETKREKWALDGCEITIDTWPWIPTLLEIEAADEKIVADTATKLGFDIKDASYGSVTDVYKKYFGIEGKTVWSYPEFRFGAPCPWQRKNS